MRDFSNVNESRCEAPERERDEIGGVGLEVVSGAVNQLFCSSLNLQALSGA